MQLQIQHLGFASPVNEEQQELIEELGYKRIDLLKAIRHLELSLKNFEYLADFPAFSYVEQEIVALRNKLVQMEKFANEFLYQPSELEGLYLIKMTSVKEVQ